LNNALTQFVPRPTRVSNTTASTLDLVLCNDLNFVLNTSVAAPFSSSDHSTVNFNLIYSCQNTVVEVESYNFDRADWQGIFTYLHNTDFDYVFSQCDDDINSVVNAFYTIITDCIANYVPLIVGTSRSKFHSYPSRIRRKLNQKAAAWRVYKSFRTPESLERYKHIASTCRSLIYQHILHRENNIVNSSNVSKFYRYANKNFSVKSIIGPLKGPSGDIIIDSCSKAELLSKTFSDLFTIDNHHCPQLPKLVPDDTGISSIVFTPGLVRKALIIYGPNLKAALTAFHLSSLKSVHFGYVSLCPIFFSLVSMSALCHLFGPRLTSPPSLRKVILLTLSITGQSL
jgi:hypothetical protein